MKNEGQVLANKKKSEEREDREEEEKTWRIENRCWQIKKIDEEREER